jgi:hypothetical protein
VTPAQELGVHVRQCASCWTTGALCPEGAALTARLEASVGKAPSWERTGLDVAAAHERLKAELLKGVLADPSKRVVYLDSDSVFTGPLAEDLSGKLKLLDELEAAFNVCAHPYCQASMDWCNVCGAQRLSTGQWLKPHWRDVIHSCLFPMKDEAK